MTIKADLNYTNDLTSAGILCTQTITGVNLTSGVFHVKLDFDCTDTLHPSRTLTQVLSQTPAGDSVAIKITDVTHSKPYSYQALHSLPYANVASQLVQMAAGDGQVLQWSNSAKGWVPGTITVSGGTVTNVSVSAPLAISNPASTPSISLPQASGSQNGYLSSADWTTFNNKEGSIAGGAITEYYRGDKSWQTLNTAAVPENAANLYFTNLRVLGVPLTGFSASSGTITAADTTLSAFEKAQGQIDTLTSASTHFLKKDSADTLSGNTALTGVITADPILGDIVVRSTPMGMTSAVNKSYVDSADGLKVNKAGDTVTGVFTLDSDLKIKGGSNYVTVRGHASSANYNLVLPSSAGTAGYVLKTDGAGNLSWIDPSSVSAGSGTVDSNSITNGSIVDADINTGAAIAQSKIANLTTDLAAKVSTTLASGNILVGSAGNVASAVSVSGDATLSNTGVLTLANTAVTAGTYSSVTVDAKGRITGGTNPAFVSGVSVTAPVTNSGTATAPNIGMQVATGSANGYLASGDFTTFNNKQPAITAASTLTTGSLTSKMQGGLVLDPYNISAGSTGEIRFNELVANGSEYTGFKAPDALSANLIYVLPSAGATSGQVLSNNGSGVLSWASLPTSMAPNGAAGGDLTGTYPDPTLRTGLDVVKFSTGVVSNTEFNYLDGVNNAIQTQLNGKQASDTTLSVLAIFNSNGLLTQIAPDTFTARSIVGTTNRVIVTDGNAVSGNPTINIDTGLLPSPTGSGQWLKSTAANTSAWTSLASSDITTALGFTPINKVGDSMTGAGTYEFAGTTVLRTTQTPVGLTDVVNKQYVDGFGQWIKNATDIYFNTGSAGIGATSVNSSAIFELTSTTKGFLPPRMTTTQRNAITSPATGLTIYNTTTGFYEYYTGSTWNLMGGGVPNGTISAFESTTCPSGWVEYTAARGQFLRGIDNGAGVDPSGTRTPGTTQADSNKSHNHGASSSSDGSHNHTGTTSTDGWHGHSIPAYYPSNANVLIVNDSSTDSLLGTDNIGGGGFSSSARGTDGNGSHAHTFTTSTQAAHAHTITVNNDGGTEARPKNIAVLYCKYIGGSPGYQAPNLEVIGNVNVTSPTNGQALVYDSATSKWVNQSVGGALGFNPVNKAGDTMTGSLTVNGNVSASGDLNTGAGQGFKIRRGTATCTINLATQTGSGAVCPVNFGYTFASAPIVTATNSNPGNWRDGVIVNTISKTTTGFSLYFFNSANTTATGDMIIDWIAIGQ